MKNIKNQRRGNWNEKPQHDQLDTVHNQTKRKQKNNNQKKVPKTQICRFFQFGKCKLGDSCGFRHELSQIQENQEILPSLCLGLDDKHLQIVTRGIRPFSSQHEMRRFVIACSNTDVSKLLYLLGEPSSHGLDRLREIASSRISTNAGSLPLSVSFQRVIVPLLHVLISPPVRNSSLTQYVNPVFAALHDTPEFHTKISVCLKEIINRENIEDLNYGARELKRDGGSTWIPKTWTDVIRPVIHYVREILQKFPKSRDDHVIKDFPKIFTTFINMGPISEQDKKIILRDVAYLPIGGISVTVMDIPNTLQRPGGDRKVIRPAVIIDTTNGPGEFSETRSMRHDNDHVDIQKIRIAPTEEEVMCSHMPFLPINSHGASYYLPEGSGIAHIDTHFRLFRHDMVYPLSVGLQYLRDMGGIQGVSVKQARFRINQTSEKFNDGIDLCLYRNAVVIGVKPNIYRGVCYEVEFDSPPHIPPKDRVTYWEATRQLMQGSLVCFWKKDAQKGFRIIFAVVADRDPKKLAHDRCRICVMACENGFDEGLFSLMKDKTSNLNPNIPPNKNTKVRKTKISKLNDVENQNLHPAGEVVMVQGASNSFFAYEPVLQSLKALAQSRMPFVEQLCRKPDGSDKVNIRPTYLTEQMIYDLNPLFTTEELARVPEEIQKNLKNTRIYDPENFDLKSLMLYSSMDIAQLQAIRAALTQDLTLIQGPPGTGKTYVGIKLVNLLLHNTQVRTSIQPYNPLFNNDLNPKKPNITPILCVCFTNHALDQFLEGLMKSGIRNIVRIGGRSKSETLEACNLRNLEQNKAFRVQNRLIGETRAKMENLDKEIKILSEKVFSKKLKWSDYQNQMASVAPAVLCGFEQNEWKTKNDFWGKWSKGLDLKPNQNQNKEKKKNDDDPFAKNIYNVLSSDDNSSNQQIDEENEREIEKRETPLFSVPTIVYTGPQRSVDELCESTEPWKMTLSERKSLIEHWTIEIRMNLIENLKFAMQLYVIEQNKLQQAYDDVSLSVMRNAQIVGMTTSGAAKRRKLISALGPRVIICEEAAEVLEAHVLGCLSSETEHLILIGDHLQLRPKTEVFELSVESGRGYNLDISLFERLVSEKFPVHTLSIQRRMRPEISKLIKFTLYPNLQDAKNVLSYPNIVGSLKNIFFFQHNHPENGGGGFSETKSKTNMFEVKMVAGLVQYFLRQGYRGDDLTILTPYLGQFMEIRKELQKNMMLFIDDRDLDDLQKNVQDENEEIMEATKDVVRRENEDTNSWQDEEKKENENTDRPKVRKESIRNHVRLATIDNFQGEESKVVIISLVRNNIDGHIGFLKTANRINVLLSRAKEGMFLLGHRESLCSHKNSKMWPQIIEMLEKDQAIVDTIPLVCQLHPDTISLIKNPEDFPTRVRDGGCSRTCTSRLGCGHQCGRLCHPDDREHKVYQCVKPCTRIRDLEICPHQHPCPKLCHKECGPCTVPITLELPCRHVVTVPCHMSMNPETIKCNHEEGCVRGV